MSLLLLACCTTVICLRPAAAPGLSHPAPQHGARGAVSGACRRPAGPLASTTRSAASGSHAGLPDTLQRFPGIGSGVYLHLDCNSRRAMRLVCKQLQAAIDVSVSGLGIASSDRDDPDEVLQRLARTSLRPSKLYLWNYSSTQTTLFLAALAAREVVPVLHGVQHLSLSSALPLSAALVISLTMPQLRSLDVNCLMDVAACRAWQRLPHLSSLKLALTPASGAAAATPPLKGLEDITSLRSLDLTYSHDMVDEGSLAACTQLTKLIYVECFPALTKLTQLQQLEYVKDLSSDSLPLLATLTQLVNLSLLTCPLHSSSQLSRFLFQHLTSLKVESIHSRDLAALDSPQLQTLAVRQLLVDCAASLRACASGILQHCSSIRVLFTYNHGQEFKEVAAGAGVRQLGPPPSPSALLEALAPWQPRPASPLPSNPLFRGPPQPSPLPTPLAQLSSTCLVQLLWAFASHEHCQAALLRAAAPVLSARILQGQLSSRRVACVAWAYARLQQLEPRLVSAILRHSMAHAEQYELRYWARLAWAFSTLGLASEEAYHQRLARLMQERQQQLQRPTPAAGAVAAAQRPSRLQQRGRGHTAAPAARPGAGQGPRRFPGIGSTVYLRLDSDSRRAVRLVCKQLRAAIDVSVSGLGIASSDRDDPDEVLQRLARTSLRPSKLYLGKYSGTSTQPTLLLAALAARELVPVLHGVQHLTLSSLLPLSATLAMSLTTPQLRSLNVRCHVDVSVCRAWQRLPHLSSLHLSLTAASGTAAATLLLNGLEHITSLKSLVLTYSYSQVDEGSLAACTQLTALRGCRWFPALTQLTQLLQLGVVKDLASDCLPLLATLPQLTDLRLESCPLQSSSQLSRFLFQHLTSLTVDSILSRDLAALDCPQLQTLTLSELQVDSVASLRACANGILQHCSSIYKLLTYNHGQEFKSAAAGAECCWRHWHHGSRALLEALAPWQPRSGKAIERLGLWHLPDVTREALEWLPVNIKSLELRSCHLLPGALSSVATRLTQQTWLNLTTSPAGSHGLNV
ncbi:hypothetical protein V8C86DRAFT_3029632 [Haematococcus lacustris]